MKVFIVKPKLTMKYIIHADKFNKEVIKQLTKYGVDFHEVTTNNISRITLQLTDNSIVIVYNEHCISKDVTDEVQVLLKKAIEKNSHIWPIAIDKSARTPMGVISAKQSYDVWEQLRCRDLDEQYISTIAKIFSRKIIAKVFPTFYCEGGEIFLSHRRIDGEDITAKIYDRMLVQAKEATPFRDVVNVKVGDAAQEVIDKVMESSDVFVFIHTPKSGESDWILKELRFALLRQIPILWIQIDDADIDILRLKPSDKPHLKYKTEEFHNDERITIIVDRILQMAFELIMNRSNQVLGYVELIANIFENKIEVIDNKKMIYHVSVARKGYHYPQRNIQQCYQLFGRTPTLGDAKELTEEVDKHFKSNEIDSIVILTNRVISSSIQDNVVFDGIEDFCYHWSRYMLETMKGSEEMEIIISGAFPDSDEIFKQSLTDALTLFAKAIIRSGYELTFGAHPTFQELFYEIAKETSPQNYKDKINMYISKWFLSGELENQKEYNKKYNVFTTNKKNDLSQSLSEMRRKMIQRKQVKALVCLGGKIKKNKKEEGIREEIELAREMNIPVFVVGSVGGCSSEVALEYKSSGWYKLNNASNELNQKFLEEIDYYGMAQEMIRYINSL